MLFSIYAELRRSLFLPILKGKSKLLKCYKYLSMGVGIWKKIKNAFVKAGNWIHNKILKPIGGGVAKIVKPILNVAVKAALAVATAIGAAKGSPQLGMLAGQTIQGVGNALGIG